MNGERATICAIATPAGAGRRGILRLSGTRTREIVRAVWCGAPTPDLARRGIFRGAFRDARGAQPLMLLWMPAPRSFTREDVAELHLPGSPPLLAAALERVLALGAEPAAPGEFTRRAFEAGRIDLLQAEGVLALVEAASDEDARAGLALLAGGLSERVERLRGDLEELRALCEASLDFDPLDTGHVPDAELRARVERLLADIAETASWEERRSTARGLPRVVLAGAPNAGKSSLFNALCRAELALVSDLPGTTRDVVAAETDAGGVPIELLDLAGFDERVRGVDRAAQERASDALASADLVLWVVDATRAGDAELAAESQRLPSARSILVWSKVDRDDARPTPPSALVEHRRWAGVSAERRVGLDALRALVHAELEHAGAPRNAWAVESAGSRAVAARHRIALAAAAREVTAGRDAWAAGAALELFAEHLRSATDVLDLVIGRSTPEDVLDRIFARFCLGK